MPTLTGFSLILGLTAVFAALTRIAWTPWCADPGMSGAACLTLLGVATALSHGGALLPLDSLSLYFQNSPDLAHTSGLSSGGPSISCRLVQLIALSHLDVASADSRVIDVNGWGLFRTAAVALLLTSPTPSSSPALSSAAAGFRDGQPAQ